MSRSTKKPFIGICSSNGMKEWKKQCNKKLRKNNLDDDISKTWKKINDNWNSPKDGNNVYRDNIKYRRK